MLLFFIFSYRNGFRGHMKSVVQDLLKSYLKVETQFQHGNVVY
jgi:acetyl-CoA carboxylase / biotin carboxylase 1